MSILKYKYKAHKFINYAFYIVVFIFGFLLGFTTQKIDFNKLISQVLMIDSVSAYDSSESLDNVDHSEYINNFVYEYSNISDLPTKNNYYNPSYIYDLFNKVMDDININYNFSDYSNVFVIYWNEGVLEEYYFYFSQSDFLGSYDYVSTPGDVFHIHISNYFKTVNIGYSKHKDPYIELTLAADYSGPSQMATTSNNISVGHQLDFTGINLEFNENLFKDNPDFKEVCVNNYDTFSITSNQIQDYDNNNNPVFHDFDFIWFPHGLAYLSVWQYDSSSTTHVNYPADYENSFIGWGYWLDTKQEIDTHFSNDNPGMYLELKDYKDKYSYYNWTFYPFEMTFTTDYHFYTVFSFDSSYLKIGGHTPHSENAYIKYLDGTIKEDSEKYCFYIKNEYDVNILNRTETGDFNSSITVLGGINKDDVTYESELGKNPIGFFSAVNSFISQIRPTVIFINTHILELYTSMPLIVRSFILSFLVLIVIRILIGMVVR